MRYIKLKFENTNDAIYYYNVILGCDYDYTLDYLNEVI